MCSLIYITAQCHTSILLSAKTNTPATKAPALAPPIFCKVDKKDGAYCFKHAATPRWYIPRNPHPHKDKFIVST